MAPALHHFRKEKKSQKSFAFEKFPLYYFESIIFHFQTIWGQIGGRRRALQLSTYTSVKTAWKTGTAILPNLSSSEVPISQSTIFEKVEIIENRSFCFRLFRQDGGARFQCGRHRRAGGKLEHTATTFDLSPKRPKVEN